MTERELNRLHMINKEIQILQIQLYELMSESQVKGQSLNGMPFSGGISNTTEKRAIAIQEIKERIESKVDKLYIVRNEIEQFIETIEDDETRLIIRLRCINNLSWQQIGNEMNIDRRTVSRKYYTFCKVAHNARPNCDIV